MQVTNISIFDYHFCDQTARHVAMVEVSAPNHSVHLLCKVAQDQENADCAAALTNEAIRQLGRMPEYRTGRRTIELDHAKMPDGMPMPELA